MIFGIRQLKVLRWMVDHPGWHQGLELVGAKVSRRYLVYESLADLEHYGFVDRRDLEPTEELPFKRVQYRSTVYPHVGES